MTHFEAIQRQSKVESNKTKEGSGRMCRHEHLFLSSFKMLACAARGDLGLVRHAKLPTPDNASSSSS